VMSIKPSKIFQCPLCNERAVTVIHQKDSDHAIVKCASCGINMDVRWYRAYDNVDAYSEFCDVIMKDTIEKYLKDGFETCITETNSDSLIKLNKDHLAKIVSFINYKSGVGKITLAVKISAALAQHYNKKVLLVDSDPQTNATFYLMEEEKWKNLADNNRTIKELFDAALHDQLQDFDLRNIIVDNGLQIHQYTNNLHLIPSHLDLHEN